MKENITDIIKGCISGKLKDQEILYKLYARKMLGISLLYTKDYTAAEDVVQEAFIKVFNNIGQFQGKGSIEGWIRKIIVNTALEKYRRQHRLYPVTEVEENSEDYGYDDIISQIAANDLIKMIHELSPQYQVVFSLYAIEGYSHEEIAQKLGISEGTSKSNLSRARKILQERVAKYYEKFKVRVSF